MRHSAIVRAFAIVVAAGAVAGAWASIAAAQQLGQVFVNVVDQDGQPVTDLASDEFTVTEEGGEATILLAQVGTQPMRIALLVDNGHGLGDDVSQLRAGLTAFLEALPPPHVLGLFTIGGQVRRLEQFTTDRARLLAAVNKVFPDRGNTRVVDGVRETLDRYYKGDEPWPVVVMVLSDGSEGSAFMTQDRYFRWINELRMAGVTIHAIQVSTRGGSRTTNHALNLTSNTGGRYRSLAAATALTNELTTLANDMTALHERAWTGYRVIFMRADSAGENLTLRVTRPDAVVQRLYLERRLDP